MTFSTIHSTSFAFMVFAALVFLFPLPILAQNGEAGPADSRDSDYFQGKLIGEFGMLLPLNHTIQYDKDGSTFDYVDEGGQDYIFPAWRISSEFLFNKHHAVILLYQPLDLRTETVLERDVRIQDLTFPEGTAMDLRYGFDFWRLSYAYDFLGDRPKDEFSLGFSMQLRNANIVFSSADGRLRRDNRNIGPVPLIKLRGRWQAYGPMWIGGEADAIYAPVKYINGSDSDVVGAFYDLNARVGFAASPTFDLFFNVRYLGGGAEGTGDEEKNYDGFTSNWLNFLTATLGVEVKVNELIGK